MCPLPAEPTITTKNKVIRKNYDTIQKIIDGFFEQNTHKLNNVSR
jgi:hypothetical protein